MSARTTWRPRTRGGCSGPNAIIGLSIKTVAQANAAPLELLDYVGIGGVYATTSKDNPNPPIGVAGLRAIVAAFRARKRDFPICGIAGHRCGQCRAGDRGRRRRRRGDLGAVAGARSAARRRASCAASSTRRWRSERDDDRDRRHHRGLGLRRRRRHPGRPEDVLGARRLWRVGHHRADRAEHQA